MNANSFSLIQSLLALLLGLTVGGSFGALQAAARRRHQKWQADGKLDHVGPTVPGSMRRVAFLIIALAGAQLIWPWVFAGEGKWWVSAGVAAGYGFLLYQSLDRTSAQNH